MTTYTRYDGADGSVTFTPVGGSAPTPPSPGPTPPAPPAPSPAPPAASTPTRQVMSAVSAADGVNKQVQSTSLNDKSPTVAGVSFAFDIPANATGQRVIEFNNASYATNAACRVAISRNANDSSGSQGFPFASRTGSAVSGNIEFDVNTGYGEHVLGSGRWYLVMDLVDIEALRASGGYQADRLFWLRDVTSR